MAEPAPMRVLLVDDHALVRHAVAVALSAPDIEVVAEAGTGEEAISLARELRPDLILLDVNLPGISGIDVARELCPSLPETKVVMLTVTATRLQVMEAIGAGAIGYLTKELAPEALQRAVRGIRDGHLPMSRTLAATTMRHFGDVVRTVRGTGGLALTELSERERQVLRLVADGRTDREIAGLLVLSSRTVEKHVATILRKLAVKNRAEAALAYRDSQDG